MNRNGIAYTSFALLSATILMGMLFTQVYQGEDIRTSDAERIGEASFFIDSVSSDTERALEIASRRSLTGATNYVVTEGVALQDAEKNVSTVLVDGELAGEKVDSVGNASLDRWSSRVKKIASRSGYRLNITVVNYSLESEGFDVGSSVRVKKRLFDPTTFASFNRTGESSAEVSVEGLEDPMITLRSRARYTQTIDRCRFDDPVAQVGSASQNSSTVFHGEVVRAPEGASVQDSSSKVLVAEDPDSYSNTYISNFDGFVASDPDPSPGSYNSDYAVDAGDLFELRNGSGVVVDNGEIYRTGFMQMFDEGCYVPSSRGPDFFQRLEDDMSERDEGFATIIDVTELPPELQKTESSVAFMYFNGSSGSLNSIKGVSDTYPWFYLDDYHVSEWGAGPLVE